MIMLKMVGGAEFVIRAEDIVFVGKPGCLDAIDPSHAQYSDKTREQCSAVIRCNWGGDYCLVEGTSMDDVVRLKTPTGE